ncbi:unnamed protein product, partial [Vitis vinifera]
MERSIPMKKELSITQLGISCWKCKRMGIWCSLPIASQILGTGIPEH